MGLPRTRRLTRRVHYDQVREKGRAHRGRWLTLSVLRWEDNRPWIAGLIVPKAAGGAPGRNTVKRRLREIIRHLGPELPEGLWLVTIARRDAEKADYAALEKEWRWLARKLGILPATPPPSPST